MEPLEDRCLLAVITVTSLADNIQADGQITLREAISAANDDRLADELEGVQSGSGADTIRFAPALARGSIVLQQGELRIEDALAIEGPEADVFLEIDADSASRIFFIDDGLSETHARVSISRLALRFGYADGNGGAIWSTENLTLNDVRVSESEATNDGGGLFATTAGELTIQSSSFHDNRAGNRGGAVASNNDSTIGASSIERNHAVVGGGGIAFLGFLTSLSIEDARIDRNSVSHQHGKGGGLLLNVVGGSAAVADTRVSNNTAPSGGGVYADPSTDSTVEILDSAIMSNTANIAGAGLAVTGVGETKISRVVIFDNVLERIEGISQIGGGGLHVDNTEVVIRESTITGNQARDGAGSFIDTRHSGRVLIETTTISENVGTAALSIFNNTQVEINASTISNNQGRGIHVSSIDGGTQVRQSTISGNKNSGVSIQSSLDINSSTIAFNGGAFYSTTGNSGTVRLDRSIVASNTSEFRIGREFEITNSLIQSASIWPSYLAPTPENGNILGVDPLLGPLSFHGGPTQTHALLPGSPAIDAVTGSPVPGQVFDQRGPGYLRWAGDAPDMGAIEFASHDSDEVFVVDTLADETDGDYGPGELSLREAMALANETLDISTIAFDSELAGEIRLSGFGEFHVTSPVRILGPGTARLSLNGAGRSRIFRVDSTEPMPTFELTLANLTLTGGFAEDQGGAILTSGDLRLYSVEIADSRAGGSGGAIALSSETNVNILLSRATLANNSAGSDGGAVWLADGVLESRQSTISGNLAGHNGGAIAAGGQGSATLAHSTVTRNIAGVNAPNSGLGGGIHHVRELYLDHTIVAGNMDTADGAPDISQLPLGSIDAVYSLIGDRRGSGISDDGGNNLIGGGIASALDPRLLPLGDYGGGVRTHALRLDSPAVNAGAVDSAFVAAFDQRGLRYRRRVRDVMDIGAVELQTDDLFVDSLLDEDDGDFSADHLTLREAVRIANLWEGHNVIRFAAPLSGGTISLSDEIVVSDAVSFSGRVEITGEQKTRLFRLENASESSVMRVFFSYLTLRDGFVDGDGGAILGNGAAISLREAQIENNFASGDGGAVYSDLSVELSETVLTKNVADGNGGAVYLSGNLYIRSSTLRDNSARNGGAAFVDGGITVSQYLHLPHSELDRNRASEDGGGLYMRTADSSSIEFVLTNNSAVHRGGAIYIEHVGEDDSSITVTNSIIRGNSAGNEGGGIFASVGPQTSLHFSESKSIANTSGASGGGLYVVLGEDSEFALMRSTVNGNTAAADGGGVALSTAERASASITTSTISGNTALGNGGGLFSQGAAEQALTLNHSTVAFNTAGWPQDEIGTGGGIWADGHLELNHTIVAANAGLNGAATDIANHGEFNLSARYSLIGDNQGSGLMEASPDENGNLIGGPINGVIDPRLGTFTDRNGDLLTHSLLDGSPAVDAGDPLMTNFSLRDQRNESRVSGRIDIGAYEWQQRNVDFDEDGSMDIDDLEILAAMIASRRWNATFNLYSDSEFPRAIDFEDLKEWLRIAGYRTLPSKRPFQVGDINLDGLIDATDLNAVGEHWLLTAPPLATPGYAAGDLNVDGTVDVHDLHILGQQWLVSVADPIPALMLRDSVENEAVIGNRFPRESLAFAAPVDVGQVANGRERVEAPAAGNMMRWFGEIQGNEIGIHNARKERPENWDRRRSNHAYSLRARDVCLALTFDEEEPQFTRRDSGLGAAMSDRLRDAPRSGCCHGAASELVSFKR